MKTESIAFAAYYASCPPLSVSQTLAESRSDLYAPLYRLNKLRIDKGHV